MHNPIRTITSTDAKANLGSYLSSLSSIGPIEITTNGRSVGLLTLPSTQRLDTDRLSVLATAYSNGLISWPQIAEETGASFGDLLLALGVKKLSLPKVAAKNRPKQMELLNEILDRGLSPKMNLSIIVADSGPLITLAVAESLDLLFSPDLPVIVPDMVRHEVIQDLSKPGAALVAEWLRKHPQKLKIAPTEVYEEFMLLRSVNPATKSKNRGEQAAAEVLEREIEHEAFGAVLIFEDSALKKTNFLIRLPDNVVVISTSEYLHGLQSRNLIASAQSILDRAVDTRGNEILARHLTSTESGEPDKNWSERMQPGF